LEGQPDKHFNFNGDVASLLILRVEHAVKLEKLQNYEVCLVLFPFTVMINVGN